MRRYVIQFLITVVASAFVASGAVFAAEPEPAQKGAQEAKRARTTKPTLDDELLKDLGPDPLANEADITPPTKKASQNKASEGDPLDQELLKGLGDGGDLGEPGKNDPLARISQQMRDVESLIARQKADPETHRRQSKIVHDIDELIRQAQQQKGGKSSSSSGANGKGGQQTASRREVSQPERGPGQEGEPNNEESARQSTNKLRQDQSRKPDMADMRDILKGVWGQLPERQREQMLQSYEEQFLPKYEQMIADYFRSLAEEQPRKP